MADGGSGEGSSSSLKAGVIGGAVVLVVVLVALALVLFVANLNRAPRTPDGAFEGTVSRVWPDGLRLDVDGGRSLRIDTWSVCGDRTSANISVGDRVSVYAQWDLFSHDAWRILDESGAYAC